MQRYLGRGLVGMRSNHSTSPGCTRDALRATGVVVLCLALVPGALAAEIAYRGTWERDAAPKVNAPAFAVAASAVRDGDRLTVSRIVYKPGTFEETGRVSGTATIRDGRVAIDTATEKRGITGRLEGTASDTDIALTGVEHVAIPDRAADDRACRVRLKRQ
jgi:hypothetical protein